ncbi:hypothetical protein [Gluconobacter wancherniae]|uniref:Uncharacterized protein n=1 Tax=Gluconobacter wancherniae NBRC 103581 TaxID=656744 RepID=A0A511AY89_9PROT|nr:hypothetical protein [Gluconobacter wancherniae]MBF0852482.1 hypothetical protein [Gluconobacter wancherniae]MBS1062180.1 hypothetical protein [Gluconobacter wancherniae]GBD56809.1 hypothetical protein NBRC103581_01390 [Gluconobacter wancherniae NBRC 103581]GBR64584.1 hypothetical protein AA103581_1401 [Gluconobacter wancherniae NBRC 103581]GEK92283.1 hypothetical protein GWA01_00530 [Gluconobacter wancherniae NBRC 103581]
MTSPEIIDKTGKAGATLVFAASQRDLEAVYIGGHKVVDHRHVLTQDMTAVEQQSDSRVVRALREHTKH